MRVLSLMLGLLVVMLALMAGILGAPNSTSEDFSSPCDVEITSNLDAGPVLANEQGSDERITARLIEVISAAGTQFTVNDNEYLNRDLNLLGRKCSTTQPGTRDGASLGCGLGTGGRWSGADRGERSG